ncbi:MAG TPA: hypothetical protein VGR90_04570 [Acidimicrobiales bacterium]|nr:hypothetical protein [Acidimicrobiales bacterium]
MGLELVEYRVWANQMTYGGPLTLEIDVATQVPQGETWRVDRIAAMVQTPKGTNGPPELFVFDQANPAPAIVPVDFTTLSSNSFPQGDPESAGPATVFYDADDLSSPITLLGGMQLALVFVLAIGTVAPALVSTRVQYARFLGTAGKATPLAT